MGAINIVTRTAEDSGAMVCLEGNGWSNRVSGSYSRSDGFSRSRAGRLNADFGYARLFRGGDMGTSGWRSAGMWG